MNNTSKWIRRLFLFLAGLGISVAADAQTTKHQAISAHVPAAARVAQAIAPLAATQQLSLAITLPFRHREALTNLLHEITDSTSPSYRHFLTREEFTERFGPTVEDYAVLKKFADANGLRVTAEHANRMLLEVRGTAAAVERAFHTQLNIYPHPTEARTFYAPAIEPSADVATTILSVGGLDNFARAQPRIQSASLTADSHAESNAGSGPGGTYRGNDFRAAYMPGSTLTGAGQVVGLLQFDGYTRDDIEYYESHAELPDVPIANVLLSGAADTPNGSGGEVEVSLDIEMVISMAPEISELIVYIAPNPSPFETILNRMVSDNLAKQLGCSWFLPSGYANAATDQIFQEMIAQGQTFFNASGDADAYSGLIDFPGDTPLITQVGGTTLTTTGPGGARISETVWNRNNGVGSGGGISTQYEIPSWQTNIDMNANQGSTTMRNIPDVAIVAENIYVRVDNQDLRVGGTSASAPLWAGFMALVNQKAAANGQSPTGFINDTLDKIGSGPNYSACFFDVTSGNNTSARSPTKFSATPGYDLCTGWGTPRGQNLINALLNPEILRIAPAAGFSSLGGVGGPFSIVSQNLTLTNAGTNSLNWSLGNTAPWLDASPMGGNLSTGQTTTVTVSLNSAASNLAEGIYNGAIWFTNLDSGGSFERDYVLAVISPPVITTQPIDQNILDGATAMFSVETSGGMPQFFQWRVNGTNLTAGGHFMGVTTSNLMVTKVSSADLGAFSVVVTNNAGFAISSNAFLALIDSAPVITLPPADKSVIVGKMATFQVAAIGSKPFHYQWSYGNAGGTNITGATNATLSLANVQMADSGFYSVTVSNALGAAPSVGAQLSVFTVPMITAINPASGAAGTNVVISGFNFGSATTDNIVYFGPVKAVVTSASATNLVVTVPVGATFSPITVTVQGLTAFAAKPFIPGFPGVGTIDTSSLSPLVDLNAGHGAIRVALGDLNGDGEPDLLAASASDGNISVYQNIAPGEPLTASSFGPRIVLSVVASAGSSPYGLAVADLDGDGRLDIIAIDPDNSVVSILRNITSDGTLTSGSFAPRIDLPAGAVLRGLAINDLNGDGKPEIVTANNGDGTVSVFENQSTPGNISFAARVDFTVAAGPSAVAIADIDGDGNPDVITVNNAGTVGAVSILQNPGIGGDFLTNSFLSRVDLPGNAGSEGIAIGDMDRDGKLDLVVGSAVSQAVSVYRNSSTPGVLNAGSFDPVVNFSGGGQVNSVSLADMDGDGRLDILSTAQAPGVFSLFKNISLPGSFTVDSLASRVDYPASANPNGIAVGDLDGDGRPDVVFDNFYDDTISIYPNIVPIVGAPVITAQPSNVSVFETSNATFTVTVSSDLPLHYQWHFNSNDILGATNNVLMLTDVQFSNAGPYSVTITNARSFVISAEATLTVNPQPFTGISPSVISPPTNLTVSVGDTATFSVTAAGTGPLQYQWFQNQTNSILNGTNSVLIITNAHAVDMGTYWVAITNQFGFATSSAAALTVLGFDHFSWGLIPSPRFPNGAFAVTVSAQDTTNATFAGFAGTVTLGTTNGVTISPPTSGVFAGGVWSGTIAISQLSSNLVLIADDGVGHVGFAAPVDIVNPPTLGTFNFGNSLVVWWPMQPAGFVLESSSNLWPGTWAAAPGAPILSNGQFLQSQPFSSTNRFFRLRFTGP